MYVWLFLFSWFAPEDSLVIKVNQKTKKYDSHVGSAVLIGPNKVLTAAHLVVIDGKQVKDEKVEIYCDYKRFNVQIEKVNRKQDLALLTLDKNCDLTPLGLAKENPKYIEKIIAVTNPNEVTGIASEGIVSGFVAEPDANWIVSDIPIFFGSSGGGVFNSSHELIGIMSKLFNFTQSGLDKNGEPDIVTLQYSVIVPVSEIRKFLNE